MAVRDLEITIQRRGKPVETVDVRADVNDVPGLRATLAGWLEGSRWDPKLWSQFSADVRHAGESKVRKTVRV